MMISLSLAARTREIQASPAGGMSEACPARFPRFGNIFSVQSMGRAASNTLPHLDARPRAVVPAGTPAWVTPALLEQTQVIWGERCGIVIGPDEALAIILRVSTLLDVLSRR
jgi:hypothetical protein